MYLCKYFNIFNTYSIHLKVEEKVMLTAGRHGGLQNMEVRGIVMLRITDPNLSKISIPYENRDSKGFQMQVTILPYLRKKFFLS